MNVSTIQEKMTTSMCSGNESTRGRPIWELAKTNNEKLVTVNKQFVSKDKCERLGVL